MGPILFIVFVILAVFVVLMMLVAIISEQYEDTKQKMRLSSANTGVLHDIHMYAIEIGGHIPCIGRLVGDDEFAHYSRQVALRKAKENGEPLSQLQLIELE